jgi:hypothetical protein
MVWLRLELRRARGSSGNLANGNPAKHEMVDDMNIDKLPEICAAKHPTDGTPITIRRGESGYYSAPLLLDVDAFNARRGITPNVVLAMLIGSMYGWDVPGANPEKYSEDVWL